MPPPRIFISYSHKDEAWKDRLVTQLRVLELEDKLALWEDRQIAAGDDWRGEIEDALETADAAVLLITADFLTSGFILDEEVPPLLRRRGKEGVRILPLIAKPCAWDRVGWLAPIQGRPKDGQPLSGMTEADADAALANLAREIDDLLWKHARRKRWTSNPIEISRLPITGEHFVGRAAELERLDAAWADPHEHVLSVVAWGGVGKTALMKRWLARLEGDDWRGAERVYGWSFYSQGTEERLTSADQFIDRALTWFGDPDPTQGSPRDRGLRLAELVRRRRTLLVLDGIEPLQHAPDTAQAGRLKDPALAALMRTLATAGNGLCLITTREKITDIQDFAGTTAPRLDLEHLSPEAGAGLLKRHGVKGTDRELRKASEEMEGHALALTLLGTYLRRAHEGEVRKRDQVPLGKASERLGGHAYRVMEAYERWLGEGPELSVLRMIGLFDRPADGKAVAALRAEPAVSGLNDGVVGLVEDDHNWALSNLRDCGLLAEPDAVDPGALDAHPLVRAYFADQLREEHPKAWRAGHERLYEHFRGSAPELPDSLEDMLPLYHAVVHGCRAGKHQEALDEVFQQRIHRNEGFGVFKLGAFGANLTALAAFFDRPWDRISSNLTEPRQAFLLGSAGFVLRALGRLREAVQPMRAGLEIRRGQEDLGNAAKIASNLSDLHLTLGEVERAVETGLQCVELADRSGDSFVRLYSRTTLADAQHHAGRLDEATELIREAEAIQKERQPEYPRLYSLQGYRYCDLLFGGTATGRAYTRAWAGLEAPKDDDEALREACSEVRERATGALEFVGEVYWLLGRALDHLSLGRAGFGLALAGEAGALEAAEEHLERAVVGLRQAGDESYLPWSLLARAAFRRFRGDRSGARADVDEALEIAERGSMRLHEADAHLELCRFHLAFDDPEAAEKHLAKARTIVEETGYGRRTGDLEYLEDYLARLTP